MSKIFLVKVEVPSGSRPEPYKAWLNKQLNPHRMQVLEVQEQS